LAHIPDEQVRKLAHPGLALRRITPELVRNVLAGPCGLGELDWRQATDLTARLAGEVWLVRRTPDGLYHRPEVRGPMLKLMANDPAHREVGPRIHAAAVDWYEHIGARPDRLSPGRAQVEALYHSLMLKSGDEPVAAVDGPDAELWRRLAQQLGPAVDELPGKVAIQVRVLRGDPIDDEDAGLLPDSVWRHWIEARGRALVDNGAAAAALDLFGTRESAALPEWLGQACLDVARWDQYWPTVRGFRGTLRDPLLVSGRYALLTGLLSQDDADLADYAAASSGYFSGLLGEGAASRASSESLFCDLLLELGMPSPWRGDVAWWRDAAWWRIPGAGAIDVTDRFPVDQLRRALTWLASPTPDATFVVGDVAALWRPDLTWMRNFARLADEQYEAALTPFLARFDSAVGGAPGMTAHQLLGEWSRDYADALGGPEIRLRLSRVREAADEVRALRGDNPELRPVIQLALAGTDVRELAGIAERLLPVPAADLRASALPEGSLSDRRTLVQLVEYIDRSGVMRAFLTAARRRWPEAELLQRVAAAFDTWDDVNNRLLDALTARLRHHRD
ncbi:MAG TPA: hypothetical protein VKU39_22050, partial [Streptosporangiaceae bacterium]|nr:hypothetical protein [Streptosporangiaceae bacterium]